MSADPMPLFLDTELTGLPTFDFPSPALISIGLVTLAGEALYVELEGIEPEACTTFVREHVLRHLGEHGSRLSIEDAALRVKGFIEVLPCEVALVSDAPQLDFEYVKKLLGEKWPANLRRKALPFSVGRLSPTAYNAARWALWEASRSLRQHHALDDAKLLRAAWIAALRTGWKPYWRPAESA